MKFVNVVISKRNSIRPHLDASLGSLARTIIELVYINVCILYNLSISILLFTNPNNN